MASGHSVERIPVTHLSNGHDVELVVHVIRGAKDGPKLAMFGGVHGDEPLGTEAVRRSLEQIDPEQLTGTIVAVPVANPYAFEAGKRVTPLDGLNLNRIIPGDSGGSLTEQLAAKLAGILDDGVTHFIDYHSGGILACVDYSYVHEAGAEMSRAYGCQVLYDHESYPGSATDYALKQGHPHDGERARRRRVRHRVLPGQGGQRHPQRAARDRHVRRRGEPRRARTRSW